MRLLISVTMSVHSSFPVRCEPVAHDDDDDNINPFEDPGYIIDDVAAKTLIFPSEFAVPIINAALSHHSLDSSPYSTAQSLESTCTSITSFIPTPITWGVEDLKYLLNIIHPGLWRQNFLVFKPPLETLQHEQPPFYIQLWVCVPNQPIPAEAYSLQTPISTVRPSSWYPLAHSDWGCASLNSALKSLAKSLLSDGDAVDKLCTKYTTMWTLYTYQERSLQSVLRGMRAMGRADDEERGTRLCQLSGVVDESCEYELRLEHYLLEVGIGGLDEWVQFVETGLRLGEEERARWGVVYGEVVMFLREAALG
ncbi:hypothetical protein K504DRAFT_532631 [Pleomassaria siparia CBS 279.74]|uniref:Uncharacterized protein n=1 Tax=Pleomassaria siparia CBS 279.74 TaxID=1314801 RepID=A0A6G1KEC6_9PLEO|nr:hypothetical protein K504DRAFT_532631 [Pleomassaria siparia CBS 279.74]